MDEERTAAASEAPASEAPASEAPASEAPSPSPRPRVQVVFEVSETSELANLLAHYQAPARRPRPVLGAGGALLGALLAGAGWFMLMRSLRNETLIAALAVGLLAGIGAAVLGGRCRANQIAAAASALLVVIGLRLFWVHLTAAGEVARAEALAGPGSEFVRVVAARAAQRLSTGALARGLLDGLGLATYAVVAAMAWRIPRRP